MGRKLHISRAEDKKSQVTGDGVYFLRASIVVLRMIHYCRAGSQKEKVVLWCF